MSNLSTFTGQANPIGDQKLMAPRGTIITLGTQEWLRSGFLASAASYPAAAAVDNLRAHSLTETASAAPGAAMTSIATDGASTFVIAYGSTAQVYTSTDGGVTWTQRNHNSGSIQIRKVIWNGTRFIGVGNDATTSIVAVTSTDGITWVANTIASGVGPGTANTAVVAWNGTVVIVAIQGVSNAYTSTSGTGSWTPRALGSTVDSAPQIDAGSFQSVILKNGGTAHYTSANGTAWSALTLPTAALAGTKPVVLSDKVLIATSGTTLQYSTDMTNWSASTTGYTITAATWAQFWRAGTRVCVSSNIGAGRIAYTINGLEWFCHSTTDTGGSFAGAQGSANIVFANYLSDAKPRYAVSTMTAPNAVGFSMPIGSDTDVGTTGTITNVYVRIK